MNDSLDNGARWKVSSLTWRGWCLVFFVCAFAGILRFIHFGYPAHTYFDEIYYGPAALDYLGNRPDQNVVHPPLGKLQIAAGMLLGTACNQVLGQEVISEYGQWRLTSAVTGTLIVLVTFLLGYHMSRGNRTVGVLAAFLVAIDFMAVTMSRVCMLDMVTAFWILVAIFCCWRYLEECWNDNPRQRDWAVMCALSLGVATACKWNGLFAAAGCWLVMVALSDNRFASSSGLRYMFDDASQEGAKETDGKVQLKAESPKFSSKSKLPARTSWWSSVCKWCAAHWKRGLGLGLLMAVVIGLIYIFSYLPLFLREGWGRDSWEKIWGFHTLMFGFRYDTKQFTHNYLSYFWEWPLVLRPIWLYFEGRPEHMCEGIVSFGSVVFWWPALVYLLETGFYGFRKADASCIVVVTLWFLQWILWSSSTTGGFIYYLLPGVPLIALVAAFVICDWQHGNGSWMVGCYLLALTIFFIIYWPFLSGEPTSMSHFSKAFPTWATRWR